MHKGTKKTHRIIQLKISGDILSQITKLHHLRICQNMDFFQRNTQKYLQVTLIIKFVLISMSVSSMTVGGKIKYKIVLLGDQYVGKTAVIDRFINNRFQTSYNATIGIDFLVRNISHNNKSYRLQLWDTAGQQRFKSLIPSYLKDSNCAIIIFDMSSPKSLDHIFNWLELYNSHKQPLAFAILAGNKIDISPQEISQQMIAKVKKQLNIQCFMISAKTGQGIQELFVNLIDLITDKLNLVSNITKIPAIEQKAIQDDDGAITAKGIIQKQNPMATNIKLQKYQQKKVQLRQKSCC